MCILKQWSFFFRSFSIFFVFSRCWGWRTMNTKWVNWHFCIHLRYLPAHKVNHRCCGVCVFVFVSFTGALTLPLTQNEFIFAPGNQGNLIMTTQCVILIYIYFNVESLKRYLPPCRPANKVNEGKNFLKLIQIFYNPKHLNTTTSRNIKLFVQLKTKWIFV